MVRASTTPAASKAELATPRRPKSVAPTRRKHPSERHNGRDPAVSNESCGRCVSFGLLQLGSLNSNCNRPSWEEDAGRALYQGQGQDQRVRARQAIGTPRPATPAAAMGWGLHRFSTAAVCCGRLRAVPPRDRSSPWRSFRCCCFLLRPERSFSCNFGAGSFAPESDTSSRCSRLRCVSQR